MVTLPSLDRANMMSLCFPKEIGSQEPLLQHVDISDEVDLLDDYQDEIAMMSLSQTIDTIQLDSSTPTATSKAFTIEIFNIVQTGPISDLFDADVSLIDDVLEGTISPMVVVFNFVDSLIRAQLVYQLIHIQLVLLG